MNLIKIKYTQITFLVMAISVPQKFRFEDVSAASILLEHGPVEAEGPVLRLIVEGHELTSGQPQWHGIIVG